MSILGDIQKTVNKAGKTVNKAEVNAAQAVVKAGKKKAVSDLKQFGTVAKNDVKSGLKYAKKHPIQTATMAAAATVPKITQSRYSVDPAYKTASLKLAKDKQTGLWHYGNVVKGTFVPTKGAPLKNKPLGTPFQGPITANTIRTGGTGQGATLTPIRHVLDKELSGKGYLAKAASNKFIEGGAKTLAAGNKSIPEGTTSFKVLGTKIPGPTLGTATGTKAIANIAKDAINLPAQAVASGYVPAAAIVEAAQGRPQRGKQFIKDIKSGDPVYKTGAGIVNAISGNSNQAIKDFSAAGKAALEHPLGTALEVAGVKGAIGRGAGGVLRHPLNPSEKLRNAATTKREPLSIPATNVKIQRKYSKDLITKAVQKRKRDQTVPSENEITKYLAKRVDATSDVNEAIRRSHRGQKNSQIHQIIKKPLNTVSQDIVRLAVEKQVRTPKLLLKDLEKYNKNLSKEHESLDANGQAANEELRANIERGIKAIGKGKIDPKQLFEIADQYVKQYKPLEKQAIEHGLVVPRQVETAKLKPFAVTHMGAKHGIPAAFDEVAAAKSILRNQGKTFKDQASKDAAIKKIVSKFKKSDRAATLLDRTGKPLSPVAIRAEMRRQGVSEPGFVTQTADAGGAKNFFVNSQKLPEVLERGRTGEATRKGTFSSNPDRLIEQAVRMQGKIDATKAFLRPINEFSAVKNGAQQRFKNYSEADSAAGELHKSTGVRWKPVRIHPHFLSKELKQATEPHIGTEAVPSPDRVKQNFDRALTPAPGDPGPFALIPATVHARLQEHGQVLGSSTGGKLLQKYSQLFRTNILSTSPKWLSNNGIEGGLRLAVNRAGPRSFITGNKTLRQLEKIDPVKAEELAHRAVGGGQFAATDRTDLHRGAEQYADTSVEPVAKALEVFWRTPGPKQLAGAWHAFTTHVFGFNSKVERLIQTAHLGKTIRNDLLDQHLMKTGSKAIEEAAQGLRDTNTQAEFAAAVDRAFGRYSKFSPSERQIIAQYTPFIAWTLAAFKFVYDVLPRDHPVLTGLIASTEKATEEWRKKHGLGYFIKGAVSDFLQGSIPTAKGFIRVAGSTPFGAISGGLSGLTDLLLPGVSDVFSAAKGQDWTGKQVTNSLGEEAALAASTLINNSVPALNVVRRIATGGGKPQGLPTAWNFKTVAGSKKNSQQTLNKFFNPFAAVGSGSSTGNQQTPDGNSNLVLKPLPASKPLPPLKTLATKPLPPLQR